LRAEFWQNVNVPGEDAALNQSLERAGRVADFLELAELLCVDALDRDESCGCHFPRGARRPRVLRTRRSVRLRAAWKPRRPAPLLNKEPLVYENVHMAKRNTNRNWRGTI